MHSTPWRYLITNSLGSLGYISVIIQWTWCLITLGQPILMAKKPLLLPQAPISPSYQAFDFGVFTPFMSLIALFVVILIVVLTIITLIKLPKAIGIKGSEVTQVISSQIIKSTHRHHHLPIKRKIRLSFWIIWLLKVVAVSTPLVLLFITPAVEGLSTRLITAVGIICALSSTIYFGLQLLLSLVLKLDKKKVW